ncbi:MAG TPA: glycosyltransferase [Flavobacterium sp.]|nr:glycosyltransferase [Flavobacterium sp.]
MRILQLIDTLAPGGAERMAVNYANAIFRATGYSAIVATRRSGPLATLLEPHVRQLDLRRRHTLDLRALFRLRRFIVSERITVLHAHSTSLFLAILIKLTLPSVTILWHDHYGDSEFLDRRPAKMIRLCLPLVASVIAVNQKLEEWVRRQGHKSVIVLPNFTSPPNTVAAPLVTLGGTSGSRIICLANLRPQKDHFMLLDAMQLVLQSNPGATLHLVGQDFADNYSRAVRDRIESNKDLSTSVFLYTDCYDSFELIRQCDIGVLSSRSEGLPVALLEYGICGKPVVVTGVGDITRVVENDVNGLCCIPGDAVAFSNAILRLLDSTKLRSDLGEDLYKRIDTYFSEVNAMIPYFRLIKSPGDA